MSAINLILADVYPTSADSKIKVIAVEPSQSVIDEGTSSETIARGGAFDDLAVGEVGESGDGAVSTATAFTTTQYAHHAHAVFLQADVRSMTFRDVVARNPLSNNIVWSRRIAGNTTVVVPVSCRC